jgi:hypothetical protein
LRAEDRTGVVTGVLWIRDCTITQRGTKVTYRFEGEGWQHQDHSTEKAGATFAVHDDVKFAVTATIRGALDLAYEPDGHVLSIWFTPARTPQVEFRPLGEIDVDRESTWASIVGALGSVIGRSPESMADDQAKGQGKKSFEEQLGDGLSVTVDLCTGLSRFGLGRPGDGEMVAPDVGETRQVPAELHPGGMLVLGPYDAAKGFTAPLEVDGGKVLAQAVCHDDAQAIARAYAEGDPLPAVKVLGQKKVGGKGTLQVKRAACKLGLVLRPLATSRPVEVRWKRPVREVAAGPLIECRRDQ